MAALHDLISTGNPDFNDPVFWFAFIITPVNTITEEMKKMLPHSVNVTFRSPLNRKAYQLWRYKAAMSYIKIIVEFGNPDNLNKKYFNSTTQPYLHAMVSDNNYGRLKYESESSDKMTKNHYVDGLMRSFLISFPEKFNEWAEHHKKPLPYTPPSDEPSEPCDVNVHPANVWNNYQTNGTFAKGKKYDIPESWDPYTLFCLMNKGDSRMANFTTPTLSDLRKGNGDARETINTPVKKQAKKSPKKTNTTGGSRTKPLSRSEAGKWFILVFHRIICEDTRYSCMPPDPLSNKSCLVCLSYN